MDSITLQCSYGGWGCKKDTVDKQSTQEAKKK